MRSFRASPSQLYFLAKASSPLRPIASARSGSASSGGLKTLNSEAFAGAPCQLMTDPLGDLQELLEAEETELPAVDIPWGAPAENAT